jgi:hypothetical protein
MRKHRILGFGLVVVLLGMTGMFLPGSAYASESTICPVDACIGAGYECNATDVERFCTDSGNCILVSYSCDPGCPYAPCRVDCGG